MKRTAFKPRQKPLRQRSARRGSVERLDALARAACLATWGHGCAFLGVDDHYLCAGRTEVMHIYGKAAYPHLRHEPLNLIPGCEGIHRYFHNHPYRALDIMLARIGAEKSQRLQELARVR